MFLPKKTGSGCRFRLRRLRKPENPAILERNLNAKNAGCNGKRWSGTAAAAPATSEDAIEAIQKFKRLYEEGVITEEEFAAKKRQLLGI